MMPSPPEPQNETIWRQDPSRGNWVRMRLLGGRQSNRTGVLIRGDEDTGRDSGDVHTQRKRQQEGGQLQTEREASEESNPTSNLDLGPPAPRTIYISQCV